MAKSRQKLLWAVLILFCNYVRCDEEPVTEDLQQSESKDGQLEIIKQIKKINDDGSYTIGYEADDGSFKIESRDVLGNIKGTYGYLDEDGAIKRVSYSTSNTSDIITEAPSTVVQRIPKLTRNFTSSTTRRPGFVFSNPTTPSTPTTTSVIQAIPKRRTTQSTTSTTSTTEKPSYGEFIKAALEATKATTVRPSHVVYATPASQKFHASSTVRPYLRSSVAPPSQTEKSEGQLIRPEVVTGSSTDVPLYRRLILRNNLADTESSTFKAVSEEPEVRGNLLRRQLDKSNFDPRQHVVSLQQGGGADSGDVYSGSVTTATHRPLFTTTIRPNVLLRGNPTEKPNVHYTPIYHRERNSVNQDYVQESTTENTVREGNNAQNVQIPTNRDPSEQLVAIRHPFHGGTVLIPLSQLRNQNVRNDYRPNPQYVVANGQYLREVPAAQEQRPVFLQRPQPFRPIPVRIDDNGFVREFGQQNPVPTPYPVPVTITPVPKYINNDVVPKYTNNDVQNEIDEIKPPVSTRDFQKLLELLIIRQQRLEQISALIHARQQEYLQPKFRPIYQSAPNQIFVQRNVENAPAQFADQSQFSRPKHYVPRNPEYPTQQQRPIVVDQQDEPQELYGRSQYSPVTYPPPQSYTPTRRVARLLKPHQQEEVSEEYLPPNVREMLLLKMLQLAINPELRVDGDDNQEVESTTEAVQTRKGSVRNVEILGEEDNEPPKKSSRNKRFRYSDYYD